MFVLRTNRFSEECALIHTFVFAYINNRGRSTDPLMVTSSSGWRPCTTNAATPFAMRFQLYSMHLRYQELLFDKDEEI